MRYAHFICKSMLETKKGKKKKSSFLSYFIYPTSFRLMKNICNKILKYNLDETLRENLTATDEK